MVEPSFLVIGSILSAFSALAGMAFEHRRMKASIGELEVGVKDMNDALLAFKHHNRELEKALEAEQADNRALSSFLVVLPDVFARLNAPLSKRSIPQLLAGTLDHLFKPRGIIVYFMKNNEELALAHVQGENMNLDRSKTVRLQEGIVGIAAARQMVLTIDDLMISESMFRRTSIQTEALPGVPADLVAPMVHDSQTLGVLCVSGPTTRHRDDKKMLKLVADLGALAIRNNELMTKYESVANADSLTGLSTRRFLNIRLGELIHDAHTDQSDLSVLLFDVDYFKKCNDTYGHDAGDVVLKKVAEILRGQLRSDDVCGRYGGEEFVVVLPNTNKDDAVRVAEKIRLQVQDHLFSDKGASRRGPDRVTLSGGVAAYRIDGHSSTELLRAADHALYAAKREGRNRIVAFRSNYLSEEVAESP